ncbi:hypothetical protein PIIN_10549 [Serendipita indica DSM 11827]|uniref:Uncharacterized protein n=1 Tax=Serendipita indica (strain DSM 11827) TaxID=1109443 RepID=G4TZ12_SERID|nr:hypothetical protein PIIN_10549 [Serendipita indica DSM 11827]
MPPVLKEMGIYQLCGKIRLLATTTHRQAGDLTNGVSNPPEPKSPNGGLKRGLNIKKALELIYEGLLKIEERHRDRDPMASAGPRYKEEQAVFDKYAPLLCADEGHDQMDLSNAKKEDAQEVNMLELSASLGSGQNSKVSRQDIQLYNMDDHSKDPIPLPKHVTNGYEVNYTLIQYHKTNKIPGNFSFAVWGEFPASINDRSKRLWRLHGDGEISVDISQIYFINIAISGGRRWYTVVTVKNGEDEKPFAVDVPLAGSPVCCPQDCRSIREHLEKVWEKEPWTVEDIYPVRKEDKAKIPYLRFNEATVPADENALYVIVSPKSSPA